MSKSNFFGPGAYELVNGSVTHVTWDWLEAELVGDRIGDRALIALAVAGLVADEPRCVDGVVGGHRERALAVQQLLMPAGEQLAAAGRAAAVLDVLDELLPQAASPDRRPALLPQ